jgi:hypothetical protein
MIDIHFPLNITRNDLKKKENNFHAETFIPGRDRHLNTPSQRTYSNSPNSGENKFFSYPMKNQPH